VLPPIHGSLEASPKGYLLLLIGLFLKFETIIAPFSQNVKRKDQFFVFSAEALPAWISVLAMQPSLQAIPPESPASCKKQSHPRAQKCCLRDVFMI
jgi:hypothetical protein